MCFQVKDGSDWRTAHADSGEIVTWPTGGCGEPGDDAILVRHSKYPDTVLRFTRREWAAAKAAIKNGDL